MPQPSLDRPIQIADRMNGQPKEARKGRVYTQLRQTWCLILIGRGEGRGGKGSDAQQEGNVVITDMMLMMQMLKWKNIYIYVVVFIVYSVPHLIRFKIQTTHTFFCLAARRGWISTVPASGVPLWDATVVCDDERDRISGLSQHQTARAGRHALGRNLKVIKNLSKLCVCVCAWEREKGHFNSYVHWWSFGSGVGGTLSGKWITVVQCSGDFNESRAVETCLCFQRWEIFWVIFNIISLFRIRGLLFITANKNVEQFPSVCE